MKKALYLGLGSGLLLVLLWLGASVYTLSNRVHDLEVQRLSREIAEKVVGDIYKTHGRITELEMQHTTDARTLRAVNVLAAFTAKLGNVQDCDGSKVKEGTIGEQLYTAMVSSGLCNPRSSEK